MRKYVKNGFSLPIFGANITDICFNVIEKIFMSLRFLRIPKRLVGGEIINDAVL